MAKILVIDDDPVITSLVQMRLGEKGHQVIAANDGFYGFSQASKERPDLILLDFNLPAADGASILKRLRTLHHTSKAPVIFVTGAPVDAYDPALKDPLVFLHPKPIDFPHLLKMIDDALAKARGGQ